MHPPALSKLGQACSHRNAFWGGQQFSSQTCSEPVSSASFSCLQHKSLAPCSLATPRNAALLCELSWSCRGSAFQPSACIHEGGHGLRATLFNSMVWESSPWSLWAGAPAELAQRRERREKVITSKLHHPYSDLIYEIQHLLASVFLTPPLLGGRGWAKEGVVERNALCSRIYCPKS